MMYAQLLEKHKKQINIFELYAGNIPSKIRQPQVLTFFSKYGRVKSVRVFPSKYSQKPFATVRFFDFQTMIKTYLIFIQSQPNSNSIYVQISRNTLLICRKCNQIGHWKNQCKQILKLRCYQKHNLTRGGFQKPLQQTIIPHIQYKSIGRDLGSSKCHLSDNQEEQEDNSLEYFCSELQQTPKAPSFDQTLHIEESQTIPDRLKNQQQDAVTNYQEQSLVIDQSQKQIIFAAIDSSSPSTSFMTQQEISKYHRLQNEGWFHKPPQYIGPFVRITQTSPNTFFY